LDLYISADDAEVERHAFDTGELTQPPNLLFLGSEKLGCLSYLLRQFAEVGIAGRHMHSRLLVSAAIRLTGRKHCLALPNDGTDGQRTAIEESVHVEVLTVCP
jgi:hypothetical protein